MHNVLLYIRNIFTTRPNDFSTTVKVMSEVRHLLNRLRFLVSVFVQVAVPRRYFFYVFILYSGVYHFCTFINKSKYVAIVV